VNANSGRSAEGRASPAGVLALFPGMGAARAGMGRELWGHPDGRRALEEFSDASGSDVVRLVTEAGEAELHGDRVWEVGIVATELAALEVYRTGGGVVAGALGFSIGAYAALGSAGAATAAQIVAMIDIVLDASRDLPGRYAMAAVTGPDETAVERLCRPGSVEISAVLGPGQTLVAGLDAAVAQLAAGIAPSAIRVTPVEVRWPLHTTLMSPVAESLERSRPAVGRLRPLRHPVYSGIDGSRITEPEGGWSLLVEHLVRPQRFDRAVAAAIRDCFSTLVELGPGTTLARAARRVCGGSVAVSSFPHSGGRASRGAPPC